MYKGLLHLRCDCNAHFFHWLPNIFFHPQLTQFSIVVLKHLSSFSFHFLAISATLQIKAWKCARKVKDMSWNYDKMQCLIKSIFFFTNLITSIHHITQSQKSRTKTPGISICSCYQHFWETDQQLNQKSGLKKKTSNKKKHVKKWNKLNIKLKK